MIPASDLWMLGLRPVRGVSAGHIVRTSGAAQPFRDMGELFPSWRACLAIGLTGSLHGGSARWLLAGFHEAYPDIAYSLMWTRAPLSGALDAFIAMAERLAREETSHGTS